MLISDISRKLTVYSRRFTCLSVSPHLKFKPCCRWISCRFAEYKYSTDSSLASFLKNKIMAETNSAPTILRVLASAVSIADNAGILIKEIMDKGELGIVDKGTNDLQTEADRSTQRSIVQSLIQKFPNLKIIGEEDLTDNIEISKKHLVDKEDNTVLELVEKCPEDYHNIKQEDIVVWVDPLDGTMEFTTGFLDHVTVLIGIAVGGRSIAGVIHQPYFKNESGDPVGRTLWSLKGVGYGGFEPQPAPTDKLIVTVTRSHSDRQLELALTKLKPDEIIRVGGAGHKVLLLLEGKAHAYIVPSRGLKKWDSCAPEAILEAVGGLLTDIRGNHYPYQADAPRSNNDGCIAVLNADNQKIFIDLFNES